jgi:hypothetical protein
MPTLPATGKAAAAALTVAATLATLADARAASAIFAAADTVPYAAPTHAETLRIASELPPAPAEDRSTFQPLPALGRGARHYASDAWHVYTAPVRMSWGQAALFAGVVGVGAVLYANDGPILDKIRAHRKDDVYGRVINLGHTLEPVGFMGDTNPIYVGTLVLGYTLRNGLGVRHPITDFAVTVSAELLQSHLTAGAFRQVGEIFVGRERPFDSDDPYAFDDGTSFPSGHASVISEFAVITSHHVDHPVYTVLAYGGALAVCLQRIDAGTHWASDTWAGMAYGAFVARQLTRRNDERRARDREAGIVGAAGAAGSRMSWAPATVAGAPGIAVRARF